MDLFKTLIELNNKIELQKLSEEKYKYDSDDDEEDKEFIDNSRINFLQKYDKRNNRQFILKKNKLKNFSNRVSIE